MGTTKRTSDPGSRSVFTYEIELTSTVCLDEFSKTSSISKQVNSRFHCFVYLTMELLKVVLLLLVTLLSRRCLHVKALETSIRLCSYRNTVSSAIIQRKKWRSELSRMPLPSAKQRSTVSLRVLLDGGGSREEQQSLLSMECDTEADSTHHSLSPKALSTAAAVQRSPSHFLSSLQFWKKHTEKGDESLTFKQKLAKAGMSTLLSYGFVSNMSYAVTVSIAWYISAKRVCTSSDLFDCNKYHPSMPLYLVFFMIYLLYFCAVWTQSVDERAMARFPRDLFRFLRIQ